MIRKKQGDLEWLEFDLLADQPQVVHAVFLRHGGMSQDSYATLNVLKGTGDADDHVSYNRGRIQEALQLDGLISARQVHGTNITHIDSFVEEVPDSDGLMTSQNNLGLLAVHADCQAAIFYDPIQKVVAAVHAGWRGQAHNIYQKAIAKMNHMYGSCPENLLVCISPSLGPDNSEFKNFQEELPEAFWKFQVKPTYFDLWAIAQHQLEMSGVLPHHIEIARLNTYADPTDFFSYRREKVSGRTEKITGGHATVVALKESRRSTQ